MATMIQEVYDALLEAGASADKAGSAAEASANYENRFSNIELGLQELKGEMSQIKWMLGLVIMVEILPILKTVFS